MGCVAPGGGETTGQFMRRQKLKILPTEFSNLFCTYHRTNRLFSNAALTDCFITETGSVYRAARAECLNVVQAVLGL